MRVLVWYWGRRGGGSQFTASVVEALVRCNDLRVTVSLSSSVESLARIAQTGAELRVNRLHPPVGLFAAARSIRGFDVVLHTMVNPLSPIGLRAIGRTPLVSVIHDATPHPGDEHSMMDRAVRDAITRSTEVITASAHVAEAVDAVRSRASHVIPLGPHLSFPDLWDADGKVLFFGRLATYKGLDLLAQSWNRNSFREAVALHVVGSGNEEELRSIREAGARVENRWVPDDEIESYLQGTRLIVLPYREASQSGVITLARAARIPVLATSVGGLPEQIGDGGRCVGEHEFASELERLLASPAELAEMHRSLTGDLSVEERWNRDADAYIEVLRTAIERGN